MNFTGKLMSFDFDYRIQNLSEDDDPGKNEWSSGYLIPCHVQGFPGKMIFFFLNWWIFFFLDICVQIESILKIHNKIEFFFRSLFCQSSQLFKWRFFSAFFWYILRFCRVPFIYYVSTKPNLNYPSLDLNFSMLRISQTPVLAE